MNESLKNKMIMIRNTKREESIILEGKEFILLMEERKELYPLLGPLVELKE